MYHFFRKLYFHQRRQIAELWSLFGFPIIFTLLMIGIAIGIHYVADQPQVIESLPPLPQWSRIHEDAAATTLSVVTGIMATAVAILYSTLFVMQTLTSTQFSPRLLYGTARHRWLRRCTSACVGTLAYSLTTLSLLGSATGFDQRFGVFLGVALAVFSIFILLFTLTNMSQTVQINYIIDRVARESRRAIESRMKDRIRGKVSTANPEQPSAPPRTFPRTLEADKSGYLQVVDFEELERVANDAGVSIEIQVQIGEFVTKEVALLTILGLGQDERAGRQLERKLIDNFYIGPIPTIEQDPEYGVRLLVDIALKAISPAVNDPSTAVTCLDYLEGLLVEASLRKDEYPYPALKGESWVISHPPVTFKGLLDRACRQLRHYGRADYAVSVRLLRLLKEVAEKTRCLEYLEYIKQHAICLYDNIDRTIFCGPDLDEIDRRYKLVLEIIAERSPPSS